MAKFFKILALSGIYAQGNGSGDGSGEEPCEYTFETMTEIICNPQSRGLRISKCGLETTPFSIDDLYMGSESCTATDAVDGDDGWWNFLADTDNCPANRQVNATHVAYEDHILGSIGRAHSGITRVRNFDVEFNCDLLVDYIVSSQKTETILHYIEMSMGTELGVFPVTMAIYEDNSFSSELPADSIITVPDPVHIAVHVNNEGSLNIVTKIEECWATPSADPNDSIFFKFIEDGCGLDSELYEYETLEVFSNGEETSARFKMDSFLFMAQEDDGGEQIFFHSSVRLCDTDIENCAPTCEEPASLEESSEESADETIAKGKSYATKENEPEEFLSTEALVYKKIMADYDSDVRPGKTEYDGGPIKMTLDLYLMSLLGISEKQEQMITSGYTTQSWYDFRLSWNSTEFNGLGITNTKASDLWKPNLILYNSDDGAFKAYIQETRALINSNAYIQWLPPALFKSSCSMDVRLFPFDRQICNITFSSSTYDKRDLEFSYSESPYVVVDPGFMESEWHLKYCPASISVRTSESGEEFSQYTFSLFLERKPLFWILNIIIPIMLMFFLSAGVFYLPVDSGEKMTLSISILLGQTVFLFLLAQRMPETSLTLPLIALYLLFTMCMVTVSVILSVVVSNIHYRSTSTHILPGWMKRLFILKIAPKVGLYRPNIEGIILPTDNKRRKAHSAANFVDDSCFTADQDEGAYPAPRSSRAKPLAKELKPAIEAIHFITEKLRLEDEQEMVEEDWKYIALIIDRCLLYVYTFICVVGTIIIFAQKNLKTEDPAWVQDELCKTCYNFPETNC
ncbi:Oidioi.mRNA.OKI2018_I69.PAR.g9262.t1.cds [Oikopleura dioica]|uniref:Oidioi.mRNA.OKI2018_I69.PAR.g9262.t1.cds n=1 Tax=Oikopleura dioica TaxID=34765 RepID=A0ABN7RJX8_OIKDI|nr:Oidioi.mRNA.OKI2018_I69.PAR.g9262.t1.cds [Oikopleura dioica]